MKELGNHWFRQWLGSCSEPSHYQNQCAITSHRIIYCYLYQMTLYKLHKHFYTRTNQIRLSLVSNEIFCMNYVNRIHVDALAPGVTWSPVTMILFDAGIRTNPKIMQSFISEEWYQTPVNTVSDKDPVNKGLKCCLHLTPWKLFTSF